MKIKFGLAAALAIVIPIAVNAQVTEPEPETKTNRISTKGVAQGSIGSGLTNTSTPEGNGKGLATIVEFRAFEDARDYSGPMVFANISALYNVVGRSAFEKKSFGAGLNADLFIGSRMNKDSGNLATLYYGAGGSYNFQGQTQSPMTSLSNWEVGPETGLFAMWNENVFTISPVGTVGGTVSKWTNPDGTNRDYGTNFGSEDIHQIQALGSRASFGGGVRARYLYADKVFAKFDYIEHAGNSNSPNSVLTNPGAYQGNVYRRILTDGRVKISRQWSAGAQYKYVVFESVHGGPVKVQQLNSTLTYIFGSEKKRR